MRIIVYDSKGKSRAILGQILSENSMVDDYQMFDDCNEYLISASATAPDLCLVRLGLGGMSGLQIGRLISSMEPQTKIIFMYDNGNYAVDAFETGAFGYLLYPVKKEKLNKAIHDIKEEQKK